MGGPDPARSSAAPMRSLPRRPLALLAAVVALGVAVAVAAQASDPAREAGPPGRVALDGPWTLRGDIADRGFLHGWQRGGFAGRTVSVPFAANASRILGARGVKSFAGSIAWYSTSFDLPAAGSYALDFESANHRADVWVDGVALGTHVGTYLPFELRFDAGPGRHTLVVRTDYRDPAQMKRDGWHRTWFNFGGINGQVTLRRLGPSDLAPPTIHTRLDPGGAAEVDVAVHVRNLAAPRDLQVAGELVRGDERIPLSFGVVRAGRAEAPVARAHVRIERPALWSPDAPNLYTLRLAVPGESGWSGRVGLRELTWGAGRLMLNGRQITLRGASLHEDAPGRGDALTGADMDELVAELKAVGANATRAQHPLSPGLLERLDAAGIMVWQEVGPIDAPGAWTSVTPTLRAQGRARVLTSLRALQYHPSIVTWSLANEVAGTGHPGGQARYVDSMARELHRLDPGRPVSLDVWGRHLPASDAALLYRDVDIVGMTNYAGWYEAPTSPRAAVAGLVRDRLRAFERVFADKVIVVSEFGAEASASNPDLAPGGFGFQTRLLATHIRAYREDPRLSGMLVWVLRDFAVAPSFAGGSIHRLVPGIRIVKGINQKGLFTYDGRAKPAVGMVRRAFEGIPTFR